MNITQFVSGRQKEAQPFTQGINGMEKSVVFLLFQNDLQL